MAHISWIDEYSVNVKLIDDQHKHFLEIMDEVYDTFSSKEKTKIMGHVIEELIEYTQVHFTTEERYFDQFKCDEIEEEEHRLAHRMFTEKVLELKKKYEAGDVDVIAETVNMLENWLIQHIMMQDKKYTTCFNAHGLL